MKIALDWLSDDNKLDYEVFVQALDGWFRRHTKKDQYASIAMTMAPNTTAMQLFEPLPVFKVTRLKSCRPEQFNLAFTNDITIQGWSKF